MKIVSTLSGAFLLTFTFAANACAEQHAPDDAGSFLKVSDSVFSYSRTEGGNVITTIGTIKNLSAARVGEIVVEVKYFDRNKTLIDSVTQPLYGIVVPPSQEVSFRARDTADKPRDSYVSSAVRVISAEQQIIRQSNSKNNSSVWVELLVSWAPMLLLISVWIFFMRRMNRKDSPQKQSVELMKQQNATLTRQLDALERLAAAVEKVTSK